MSRSGKHTSPRVEFHANADEIARWRADAEEEGLSLSDWMREAARAYYLIGQRKDGRLTDADWRRVVAG